jgi:glutaminyl-tRNA synthetase
MQKPNKLERHGYFVADKKDNVAGKPVFNTTVTLRDAWQN